MTPEQIAQLRQEAQATLAELHKYGDQTLRERMQRWARANLELIQELEGMETQRDTYRAVLEGMEYERIDSLPSGGAKLGRAVGMSMKARLQHAHDDATFWATVADGVSHDPRCANYFTGGRDDGWTCLRCQVEALTKTTIDKGLIDAQLPELLERNPEQEK